MTIELKNKTALNMLIYMDTMSILKFNNFNILKKIPSKELKVVYKQQIQ